MSRMSLSVVVGVGAAVALTTFIAVSASSPDIARSNKRQIANPLLPANELEALTDGHRVFAMKLYEKLRGADGNLLYSPYSIAAALSMTKAGARGETEKQMMAALGLTIPDARVHVAMNALSQQLERAMADGKGDLSIANRIWLQEGEKLLTAYLDCLAENYGAGVGLLDFARQSQRASKAINAWVSRETQGKISELVTAESIQQAVLVLTNAIYFKGFWAEPFKKEATRDEPFHLLDGRSVHLPMMWQHETLRYAKLGDVEIVELPYRGGLLAMRIIVPAAGQFADVESALDAARLKALGAALRQTSVSLGLPKFTFAASLSLSRTLAAMGMMNAFSTDADFSGMNGKRNLLISDVVHRAFIAVDEQGTEAAAATGVAMACFGASMIASVNLTIDRPFVFEIVERATGEVLFVGRVVDPRGN